MITVFVEKRSFHLCEHKLIPTDHKGRGSSVVERIIGNDEVGSSILPRGTSFIALNQLLGVYTEPTNLSCGNPAIK